MFSESLTVRILADSSGFRTEVESALSLLDRFSNEVAAVAGIGQTLAQAFQPLSQGIAPLRSISRLLTLIQKQIRAIGQTPLTINVKPALAALRSLSAAIAAAAARLRALSAASSAPTAVAAGKGAQPLAAAGSVPRASAAAALPAAGLGRQSAPLHAAAPPTSPLGTATASSVPSHFPTPAQLTVNLPASAASQSVENSSRRSPSNESAQPSPVDRSARSNPTSIEPVTTNHNHFGGITVNVRETADVTALVRDLRLQGIHLRNRRG